ncbi:MAG: hypothetical protein UT41_C0001G0165 [Candidatus Wolfebacteria bacterium GW2011_GWC2_39_22]|uniref:Uncharacterized protein n=1 Tax=Candidatus Wolfebacteria bacterium GW2011_GWC2_39_22 TaxID=1619013 RepID=A0A0G0NIJ4_9BACT|nr:MAG: hypothetical protein UT41_C0001G0165 [Candidatus Wolfebacteria bacterium GW2011_GWC2_39_22]
MCYYLFSIIIRPQDVKQEVPMKTSHLLIVLAIIACSCWITGVVTGAIMKKEQAKAFETGRSESFGRMKMAHLNVIYELRLVGVAKDDQGVERAYNLEKSFGRPMDDSFGGTAIELPAEAKAGDKIYFDPRKKFVIVAR